MQMVERALAGDRRALGQVLRRVEDGTIEGRAALRLLYPRSGQAQIVGVTGAPGSEKAPSWARSLELRRRQDGRDCPGRPSSP
ncbi:MAG: hypothetical protein U0556_04905 [Dehalococcoidia bacterium]